MTALVVTAALLSTAVLSIVTLHLLLTIFTPQPCSTLPSEERYTTTPTSTPLPLPRLSSRASIHLSIVIPAYNEADRLSLMVDEVMEYFQTEERRRKGGVEVLIVDDGSQDGTSDVGMSLAEKWSDLADVEIRVIRLQWNRGKGGAVQHGMVHARGALLLFADADGATRFSDLDGLLVAMEKIRTADGQGMVVGSRAHLVKSDAVVKRSVLRNALMHGFHLFLRTLGVSGIRDTQCGFKLFTRPTALLLFPTLHLPRWSFDVELLLLASLTIPPIPVSEIPVAWHEVNGSKIRLGWDSIGMARDLLVLRGNLFTGRWKVPIQSACVNGSNGVEKK